jgi:hypothetical protein
MSHGAFLFGPAGLKLSEKYLAIKNESAKVNDWSYTQNGIEVLHFSMSKCGSK